MRNKIENKLLSEIQFLVKDKEVLDVGCIEHSLERKNKEKIWIHDFIKKHAKHVIGIDLLEHEIAQLKEEGYDVYFANAENFELNKKFDVIFAGELIEHLSNQGLFLGQCKKHLKKDGILIITTPNAFNLRRLLYMLLLKNDPPANSEHTCWYSPQVIKEILNRYDFQIEKISFVVAPEINKNFKSQILKIGTAILGSKLKETMFVVAKQKS